MGTPESRYGIPDDDPFLIARMQEGDVNAYSEVYRRYFRNVWGYARSIIRDDQIAEDASQVVFAKLFTNPNAYKPQGVPFFAWLIRLTRNAAIDELRKRRDVPSEDILPPVSISDPTEVSDSTDALWTALGTLPDEQREVVLLRHVVGLSPGEIAERMEKTESSIHGLHHRGRRALQGVLAEADAEPSVRPSERRSLSTKARRVGRAAIVDMPEEKAA